MSDDAINAITDRADIMLTWLDDEQELLLQIKGGECAQLDVMRVVQITVLERDHEPTRHVQLLLRDDDDDDDDNVD